MDLKKKKFFLGGGIFCFLMHFLFTSPVGYEFLHSAAEVYLAARGGNM